MGEVNHKIKSCYVSYLEEAKHSKMKLTINKEQLDISPGLLKLFDELLMNAYDHIKISSRTKTPLTYIKIICNDKYIGCKNDGKGIPIKLFNKTDKYVPEILFTQPRSGSNFDEETEGAGQNGIGIKLTTILSKNVRLKIVDKKYVYRQTISNNCSVIESPCITKNTNKSFNLVSYKFIPDLNAIEKTKDWDRILENTQALIFRRVLDINSLIENDNIRIFFNDIELPRIDFESYAMRLYKAYLAKKSKLDESVREDLLQHTYYYQNNVFKLFIGGSPSFEQISFINGVSVEDGGVHIKYLIKILNDEFKPYLNTNTIKNRLFIVFAMKAESPKFTSQAKVKLSAANNLDKISFSKKEFIKMKNDLDLEKIFDEKKKETINNKFSISKKKIIAGICPKLIDAEDAGKKGKFNTLFICEGDSASSLAKIGMACTNIGHKNYGCFPLQGKINNIRNGTDVFSKWIKNPDDKDLTNKVNKTIIFQLFTALGIKPKMEIKSLDELRYQRIVMLKDADSDGANILGLVYNLFDVLFQELLQEKSFFCEFITPMIKVYVKKSLYENIEKTIKINGTIVEHSNEIIIPFYNNISYETFMKSISLPKNTKVEFIKGLAGHQQYEIKEYFKYYEDNLIAINYDNNALDTLNKAFSKKNNMAQLRRDWMNTLPKEGACLERVARKPINITDFMNTDHLQYMYDSAARVLPSSIDGLKTVQRKIIFGLRKQSNCYEFRKVFQLAGVVANVANYHHGDQSLNGAIIKMTQDYPGSNNIPLLDGKGFFGSRLELGDDSGQPRYIDVKLSKINEIIFPKIDDDLLEYKTEDNMLVEPRYYIPIVPLLLINGCVALATGYSCRIVKHSALKIIEKIINRLNKEKEEKLYIHINKWNGKINLFNKSIQYIGTYERIDAYTIHLTEIPITMKINDLMNILQTSDMVKSFKNNTNNINVVDIKIKFNDKYSDEEIVKELHLIDSIAIETVRSAIDKDNKMTYYDDNEKLFNEWYDIRYNLYIKRKNN